MRKYIYMLLALAIFYLLSVFYVTKIRKSTITYAVYELADFERKNLNKIIEDFMNENPRVKIEIEEISRDFQVLKEGIKRQKNSYDICLIPDIFLPIFLEEKLVHPISKYAGFDVTENGEKKENYSHLKKREPHALLYNHNLMPYEDRQFLEDINKFENFLIKLRKNNITYPMMIEVLLEDYNVDEKYVEKYLKEYIEIKKERYYKDLVQKKLMVSAKDTPWVNKYRAFLNKKTAFIVSSIQAIEYIRSQGVEFDFTVFLISPDHTVYETLLGNRYIIGKNSKNPEIAFKFIEYMNSHNKKTAGF